MELVKSNIHMSRIKECKTTQITLDDDFIVQDIKPDIEEIISNKTDIEIESVKILDGKVVVRGKMSYAILYMSADNKGMCHMEGNISIDEIINMDGINESDEVSVEYNLEDLNISMINSRKINVRGIVSFTACSEEMYDEEAIVDVNDDNDVDYIKKPLEVMKLIVSKKDVYRVKEETELPSNKPNMGQLLWSSMSARNVQIKLAENRMDVSGELIVFIMYEPEEEQAPLQWFENIVPFSGNIDMPGVNENMITNIVIRLSKADPEIYKDYDGENRMIRIDAAIEMDIKVYEEEKIDIITDIYSPHIQFVKNENEGHFERLLAHNQSRNKVTDRIKIDSGDVHVMQICNADGAVKIDDTSYTDEGIVISGVVEADIIYMSSDDNAPIQNKRAVVPFEHLVEVKGIDRNTRYYVRPSVEQLSASMVSTDEIELKSVVGIDVMAIEPVSENIITDVSEEPLDMELIKGMPGIVVHIVEDGESLWTIAKKFYTTVENIKELNDLQGDNIDRGDKLILVKQVAISSSI